MSFTENTEQNKGNNLISILYVGGAAIIILGFLFKIYHLQGAVPLMILGMCIESIIFLLSCMKTFRRKK